MSYRVKEGYTVAVGRGVLRPGSVISDEAARHVDIESLLVRGVVEEIVRPAGRRGTSKKTSAKRTTSEKAGPTPNTRRTTRTAKGAK